MKMKGGGLILSGLAIVVVAIVGLVLSKVLSVDAHVREMMVAGMDMMLVCGAAQVPMRLSRGANQLVMVQAGLVSSAVHLLGSAIVASTIFVRGKIATYPLLIWLGAFFAVTLITVTISIAQQVRKAPAAGNRGAENHA